MKEIYKSSGLVKACCLDKIVIQDQELQKLACELPSYLFHSKINDTVQKCNGYLTQGVDGHKKCPQNQFMLHCFCGNGYEMKLLYK